MHITLNFFPRHIYRNFISSWTKYITYIFGFISFHLSLTQSRNWYSRQWHWKMQKSVHTQLTSVALMFICLFYQAGAISNGITGTVTSTTGYIVPNWMNTQPKAHSPGGVWPSEPQAILFSGNFLIWPLCHQRQICPLATLSYGIKSPQLLEEPPCSTRTPSVIINLCLFYQSMS